MDRKIRCYVLIDGQLVVVTQDGEMLKLRTGLTQQTVDDLNAAMGITPEQAKNIAAGIGRVTAPTPRPGS